MAIIRSQSEQSSSRRFLTSSRPTRNSEWRPGGPHVVYYSIIQYVMLFYICIVYYGISYDILANYRILHIL